VTKTKESYLSYIKQNYEREAGDWSYDRRNLIVGSYDAHNNWPDYNDYLFKGIDTKKLVALDYGCGPGRCIIQFNDRFSRIDGVDIAMNNLRNARSNCQRFLGHCNSNLYVTDGSSIPVVDESYDLVYSVICLQHICSYDVRFNIMNEIYRVLKPNGYFCFQMGFGRRQLSDPLLRSSNYYENAFDARGSNGWHDVEILDESVLKNDLLDKIGFREYESNIRPTGPGDVHENWIWVRTKK
jgi:ubiquinone/menaquinone biosynthesis C-methylase UbiE